MVVHSSPQARIAPATGWSLVRLSLQVHCLRVCCQLSTFEKLCTIETYIFGSCRSDQVTCSVHLHSKWFISGRLLFPIAESPCTRGIAQTLCLNPARSAGTRTETPCWSRLRYIIHCFCRLHVFCVQRQLWMSFVTINEVGELLASCIKPAFAARYARLTIFTVKFLLFRCMELAPINLLNLPPKLRHSELALTPRLHHTHEHLLDILCLPITTRIDPSHPYQFLDHGS